jgi:hypothetical protein
MKLRIHGNSIRLRLNRREVAQFAANGCLEEAFEWGTGPEDRRVYGLEASQSALDVGVRVSGRATIIILPTALAQVWSSTDRIEVTANVRLNADKLLSILVEKEFRRLHGVNNDPDLYPNPLEAVSSETHHR